MGVSHLSSHRLPIDHLLFGPQEKARAKIPRRGGSPAARSLRKARDLSLGAKAPGRRGCRRSVRLYLGSDHAPRDAAQARDYLLLDLGSPPRMPRARKAIFGLGSAG